MAGLHQTTKLSPGRHRSPKHGTCTMELASLLGGERFSDHPARVCAVLAAFLRGYNDATSADVRQSLFGVAATVVDSRTTDPDVREERIHALLDHAMYAWRHRGLRHVALPLVFDAPSGYTDIETAGAYVGRIARRNPGLHARTIELIEELVARGRPAAETAAAATTSDVADRGADAAPAPAGA